MNSKKYNQKILCSLYDPNNKLEWAIINGFLHWSFNGDYILFSRLENFNESVTDRISTENELVNDLNKFRKKRTMCETCVHKNLNILKGCNYELYKPIEID